MSNLKKCFVCVRGLEFAHLKCECPPASEAEILECFDEMLEALKTQFRGMHEHEHICYFDGVFSRCQCKINDFAKIISKAESLRSKS